MNHPKETPRWDAPAGFRPAAFFGRITPVVLVVALMASFLAIPFPAVSMDADIVTGVVVSVDPAAGSLRLEVRQDSWLLAWLGNDSRILTVLAPSSSWPAGLGPGMTVRACGRYLDDQSFTADVLQERDVDATGVRSRLGRGSDGSGGAGRGSGGRGGGAGKGGGRGKGGGGRGGGR